MDLKEVEAAFRQQKSFFNTDKTKSVDFRTDALKSLRRAILKNRNRILKAVSEDMGKPPLEAYSAEIGIVLGAIDRALRGIKKWVKPRRVRTPAALYPSKGYILPEPLGVVLIIGPWNYPFNLVFCPLVDAIAAGNCAIIKPSEISESSASLISEIISETFEPGFIRAIEGGVDASTMLLKQKFDYIFYTGNSSVGRIVMEAASANLTPLTLELGGKSPCIVDCDADLMRAARRITWGKFFNAGQTCIAPDYLLVDRKISSEVIAAIKGVLETFYGKNPSESRHYARIINARHFERLKNLLREGNVIHGGSHDSSSLYVEPTLIVDPIESSELMNEEIFGPILPIIEYESLDEAVDIVNSKPKPLALYFFSCNEEKQESVIRRTSSGGICINGTVAQYTSLSLPFGGVGESGFGRYHGKNGFEAFSNMKSVMKRSLNYDMTLLYPPHRDSLAKVSDRFVRLIT